MSSSINQSPHPNSYTTPNTDQTRQSQVRNVSIIRSRRTPESSQVQNYPERNYYSVNNSRANKLPIKSLTKNPALLLARRAKTTAVNSGILSWSMMLWFFVQLPFAVFSVIMLGLMGVMDQIAKTFAAENEVSGDIGSWLYYKATEVAGWIAEKALAGIKFVTGIDLNIASMADGLFLLFLTIAFTCGFVTLIIASLIYITTNHRPMSGEGSGLKIGLFILAIVGYMVPVLNLFPWHLPWLAAVWKYPK
jgi:hypothetical protein